MIEALTVGPLGERCYILPAEEAGTCILVDPGDEARRILARLGELGLQPAVIAFTHGHLDHTAALPDILEALGREGRQTLVAIHREDAPYLGEGAEEKNRLTFSTIRAMGFFKHYFRPMPKASLIVADGDLIPGSTWKVIHTPGHTRGSVCFYDEKAGILVSGDTLFLDGVGRTDGPDSDTTALEASIQKKLFCLPASTIVYPGHGEPTTIGHERGDRAR
jgi:glyoxylase-like metal-dependent hydrolase (beta-lactamase superfamily II)